MMGLLWNGHPSVASNIAAIPALIAAWLAETGSCTRDPAPMAREPREGCSSARHRQEGADGEHQDGRGGPGHRRHRAAG
jgi:hypothetical protein